MEIECLKETIQNLSKIQIYKENQIEITVSSDFLIFAAHCGLLLDISIFLIFIFYISHLEIAIFLIFKII